MAVAASDVVFRKSKSQTNEPASNGGRMARDVVTHGVRHGLMPRVTRSERLQGVTRTRKIFMCNDNAANEQAYDVHVFFAACSPAGDHYLMAAATHTGMESEADAVWCGVGRVAATISPGATQARLNMETAEAEFPNGGRLWLCNNLYGGSVAADVNPGDSVVYDDDESEWIKAATTTDIIYPKGIYLGSHLVITLQNYAYPEYLDVADNHHEAEAIGTGDGVAAAPTLTQLSHHNNGICGQPGKRPMVMATCGGVARTVAISKTGACSGYCSAGQLNMTTGAWTTPIVWTTPPDNGSQIVCDYRELCYSYEGNVATVQLAGTAASLHSTSGHGAGCVLAETLAPAVDGWLETSAEGGYDEATYPLGTNNRGTVEDVWTLTFTSTTGYTVTGAATGLVGSGSRAASFAPVNPDTGTLYFALDKDGWSGTWVAGETIVFATHPATLPLWIRQIVPAGIEQAAYNYTQLEYYLE